ncbi:Hsp20 family protein, partial [Mesorhizobium sp. WSM4305]
NGTWPSVEFSETDKEIRVTAEIPGLHENDIEVMLDDGVRTLRGEKKAKTEDKDRQCLAPTLADSEDGEMTPNSERAIMGC